MDQFSGKNESAPFKLPEVQPDPKDIGQPFESAAKNTDEKSMAKAVEQNAVNNNLSNFGTQATSPIIANPLVLNDQSTTTQPTGTPKKIAVTDSLQANDAELIEKAWVAKAKTIVEQTRNNPYEQSNELNRIRDDYQSKRFKNLKIDNE
jgi:hypothetical protein